MKKFYIVTNRRKDRTLEITSRVQQYIESKGGECTKDAADAECILTLGGDGTLIRAAREFRAYHIALLGINLGTLGYLTEVEVHNIENAIDQLMQAPPSIEKRMMLKGTLQQKEDIALNDIVVTRLGALRVIHFNVYVNGTLLNSYQADGVILSTPTGSTGYNLSAGGPIVQPTASMIVMTPICPHALNTSSIVFSAEDEIVVEIGTGKDNQVEEAGVSFDGNDMIQIHTGDRIVIKKAEDTIKLLKLSNISFLETLRKKMKGN